MQTSKQSKANRASHRASHAYNKLRLPSHTGRRSQRGYRCSYDCTEIYRRSHAGYACTYDCTEIYREEGRKEGREGG